MSGSTPQPAARRRRRRRGVALAAAVVCGLAAAPAADAATLTFDTARVAAPGNPTASFVPFTDAIYSSCAVAPQGKKGCVTVGSVGQPYDIGELEVTVAQWVAFLNTANPRGLDPH